MSMDILEEALRIDPPSEAWVRAVSKLLPRRLEKKRALDTAAWMDGNRIPFYRAEDIESDTQDREA